jgi:hypothetical protein
MSSEIHTKAADTYRRLVAVLYREIGVLDERNHAELAKKRVKAFGFFATPQRKIMAKDAYQKTKKSTDLDSTSRSLQQVTGLTLADVHRAFAEGKWAGSGFGGAKWARIAEVTASLREALMANDTDRITELLSVVQTLEHNNGKVVSKFPELGLG